jgi:outer membrane lipoprotein SlyB
MPWTSPVGAADSDGVVVGLLIGASLASEPGVLLGAVEGAVVGWVLGGVDGAVLGSVEAAVLGSVEGAVDGASLGCVDGASVGSVDGEVDGAVLGSVEGFVVGSSVGQSMKSDFFVWTAGLSTLLPKVRSLSGHGLAVYPSSDQPNSWMPSFSVF